MNHLIEFLNVAGGLAVLFYGAVFVVAVGALLFDRHHTEAASMSETLEERHAA